METVKKYYRYMHRHPEVSGQEEKTSAYIESALGQMGYQPQRFGRYGIAADLVTDENLPWLLLRADMDALPVLENSCVAWPSENTGVLVWLGIGDVPPLHNSAFYVPEDIFPIGVNFWETVANQKW